MSIFDDHLREVVHGLVSRIVSNCMEKFCIQFSSVAMPSIGRVDLFASYLQF